MKLFKLSRETRKALNLSPKVYRDMQRVDLLAKKAVIDRALVKLNGKNG
jgi:hypothetical protein